ncbi:hypothetical protein GDO81_028391 [Engystomops pustulosus]|uniref:cGMP-dependent protein kinase interacting domain-containing protein n=1 Tax=Engystomops pustulosus TaxID=76066 RepID=A0AAV6ZGK9_ENGPU|nr:hypothetical protein GDO81_028391 [Engystomops pustulosus]
MLQDARQWLNARKIEDTRHPKTGASALHVAAAKGYIEVMRLLLQAGFDPNVRDKDGWTPLHAAAHWGVEEASRLLVENFCDMNALNNVGQRPCDVADEEIVSLLEELQKKQEDLRSEKEANLKRAVIDTTMDQQTVNTSKHRRSSVCRMSSKEKISVQDQSKERKTLGTINVGDEESSFSSEEDNDSINDPKTDVQVNENGLLPEPQNSTLSPSLPDQKPLLTFVTPILPLAGPIGPSMWRQSLRKTGIILVPQRGQKAANKEPLMARIPPTPTRRIFSLPETDSLPDAKKESYQTPVRDEESESQRKARSRLMRQSRRSTQGVTLTDLKEAEKTLGKSVEIQSTEQKDERGDKEQTAETPDQGRRSRLALNTEAVVPAPVNTVNSPTKKELETVAREESETENLNHLTTRDRRRWRKELRTGNMGVPDNEGTEAVNHNETSGHREKENLNSVMPYRAGTYSFSRHKEESDKDYKKLYEDILSENESLREQLQEAELKLTQLKLELERVMQRQERHAERPALLELERFERRALERKAAELEEELKVLSDLKADNQRLKDENAALIRVISKLSK